MNIQVVSVLSMVVLGLDGPVYARPFASDIYIIFLRARPPAPVCQYRGMYELICRTPALHAGDGEIVVCGDGWS